MTEYESSEVVTEQRKMPPYASQVTETITETVQEKQKEFKADIVWKNVIAFVFLHAATIYGFYLGHVYEMTTTIRFSLLLGLASGMGVTAGAHRLWCHRSYKAKWPLRVFLMLLNCVACQNDIYEWSRDHRVHHKFTETDADPHNVRRGFFFAHMGWLMCKKHPDVREKGKSIDCSDILEDPIIRFQRKYYVPLATVSCFVLPTLIPYYFWDEDLIRAFIMASLTRYVISLNITWLVNSAAHKWGTKPYDKYIDARDNNLIALGATGEGFHNYHHTFPWDYSTSEYGWKYNLSTMFIDLMAFIGQAYDLRKAPPDVVRQRMKRTGEPQEEEHEHPY